MPRASTLQMNVLVQFYIQTVCRFNCSNFYMVVLVKQQNRKTSRTYSGYCFSLEFKFLEHVLNSSIV